MATDTATELKEFRDFLDAQLGLGETPPTPEECLSLWRERQEANAAIREALDEMRAGKGIPLDEFIAGFRRRNDIDPNA